MFVADSNKLQLQKGYTGFGGIPGFIMVNIILMHTIVGIIKGSGLFFH